MAIFYLDLEGGNDANDGLSFANRWKTIANGATAARTAPGDVIRVMATPDPVSLGNATWTDNSDTVTFSSAKNKLIDDCETGWVATTNVTASFNTPQKTGAARLQLVIATAFTTGKAAYKTLASTMDLSAFEQLSFWFQASTGTTAQFSIRLCSDATGDTPVATLTASLTSTADYVNNVWKPIVLNNGASLGAGINSIAIYVDVDPGSVTWRFDNIAAAKAAGSADEVTHRVLIGKNTAGEPEWYNIAGITDTGASFDGNYLAGPSADQPMPYRGATGSVETFKRYCFAPTSNADMTTKESGTAGLPILYSGGWNRTDMSTQSRETWLAGHRAANYGISFHTAAVYLNTEKFGFTNFQSAGLGNVNGFQTHDVVGFVGCTSVADSYTSSAGHGGRAKITCDHVWGCNAGAVGAFSRPLSFKARLIHGDCDNAASSGAFSGSSSYSATSVYEIDRIENNRTNGIYCSAHHNLKLKGTTFKNNLVSDIYFNSSIYAKVELEDCSLLSPTPVTVGSQTFAYELYETRIGGDPNVNKTTRAFDYFNSQATVVNAGSVAWELGFTQSQAFWSKAPALHPLLTIACAAGKLVTVKAWLRRTSTSAGAGLHLAGDSVQGFTETTVWMTAAINTWQEVTLTFTPITAGVFEIQAAGFGAVGDKLFFDGAITVTQAA